MKRRKSAIMQLFNYFIYYKIFELAISIFILAGAYTLFPKTFNFIYNIIITTLK